jgi:cysteine dioxygenase
MPRCLCSLGTGEVIHVLNYKALEGKVDAFEFVVQGLARCLYKCEASVTDVRVCHPCCGEVVFIVTFVSKCALKKFEAGPQAAFEASLQGLTKGNGAAFCASGTMMPAAHTLASLLDYLKENVRGDDHTAHDVRAVRIEMEKWYPRPSEFERYLKTDPEHPSKYTRNLIYGDDQMDVIMMCWPPGSQSTIHDHDASSCWVTVVEGVVHEVQFQLPRLDRKFLEAEQRNPATAVGHCGALRVVNVAQLDTGGVTGTYANNDIGIHRVENRTSKMACTLHVYAPPLRKMKIFTEAGDVHVHVAKKSAGGGCDSAVCTPDCTGIFDVEAWNAPSE